MLGNKIGREMGVRSKNLRPFELKSELGRGAMTRVWRAYDPNLKREVAIRELFSTKVCPRACAKNSPSDSSKQHTQPPN